MHAFLKGGTSQGPPKSSVEKSGASGSTKPKKNIPWVEKYRPSKVDEVAHQDEVVAVLKKSMMRQDLPNLLFYGPPGTGKTSTILAASKELFGDIWRDRVLELNASDERGINVVREKVKNFAQLTAGGHRKDGKSCPSFKIVILDEADSMTKPAQAALRRTMEKQSKTTRFCLICNYVSRLIEPITSRCAKFRFKPVARGILLKKLKEICEKESVTCEDEALESLLDVSEGDMRKAITYLQSVSRLKKDETIIKQDIYDISGVIPENEIDDLITVCQTDSYEKLEVTVKNLMAAGHAGTQIISQLHDRLIQSCELSDKQKAPTFERLAIVDKRLMDGADEYLQIMDVCTVLMHQICHGNR